jgi:acyl carrier protein
MTKSFYRVPETPEEGVQTVGQPMPQTQLLILSTSNQLCGIGEPGQIAIRTHFGTLGYVNAPEEQQRRFIPNPYGNDVIYLTGDLGRYRPDGMVDIMGRLDDQVKIHGVRVEPAEIATVLSQHPAVADCVIKAYLSATETPYLTAFVTTKNADTVCSIPELRAFLSRQLPAAFVPGRFIFLSAIPFLPNGKIDYKALPDSEQYDVRQETPYVAPRNPIETRLATIWGGVLERDVVGIHDNFFDLGGHSLLATQILFRITEQLQITIPVRRFFEHPTIVGLANYIAAARTEKTPSTTPAIQRASRRVRQIHVSTQGEISVTQNLEEKEH